MQIGRQDPNLFLNDGAGGDIMFLRGVPGSNNVAVAQMKAGAANQNLSWFVRGSLILRIFEHTDGRKLGAVECRRG
jgi:hypothetical protein